jgi:hypothetical protein
MGPTSAQLGKSLHLGATCDQIPLTTSGSHWWAPCFLPLHPLPFTALLSTGTSTGLCTCWTIDSLHAGPAPGFLYLTGLRMAVCICFQPSAFARCEASPHGELTAVGTGVI